MSETGTWEELVGAAVMGSVVGNPYETERASSRITLRLAASRGMFCSRPSCGACLDCETNCVVLEDIAVRPGIRNVPRILALCDACGEGVSEAVRAGTSPILRAKVTRARAIEAGAALPVMVEAPAWAGDAAGQRKFRFPRAKGGA